MQPDQDQGLYQPDADNTQGATPGDDSQIQVQPDQSVAPAADVDTQDEVPEQVEEYDFDPISWTAKEFIHREKSGLWFGLFGIAIVLLGLLSFFVMHSWTFIVLLVVIAVVVVVFSRRPPHDLKYDLDGEGLRIDDKLYQYNSFKAFGVVNDDGNYSIVLIPTQRLQPSMTVYFPEDRGEEIVDVLGSILPMKDIKLDPIDKMVRMLRL